MRIKACLVGLMLLTLGLQSWGQPKKKLPNIVFIFSDDLSFRDLSCYGQTNYKTPNLDALASTSTRFTQAYTAAPECAPSRGCMLTGMHLGKSPIRNNSSARGFEYLPDSAYTFAEMLKKAGYTNAVVGKWGLGNKNTPGFPLNQGFDYHYGYLSHFEAHSYFPWKLYENGKDVELKGNQQFDMEFLYAKEDDPKAHDYESMYNKEGKLIKPEAATRQYASDLFDEKALNFIDQHTSKPFFLYFTTNLPHGPAIVDDLRDLKDSVNMPILSREWGAMVQRLDESVGKLIAKLKQRNLYDQTIIIFASDNGYSMHNTKKDKDGNVTWPDDEGLHNKGPFDGGKFSAREGGMRIPFFIHYPRQASMQVVTQPVWLLDLFPTLAEVAQQPMPKGCDGYSLMPMLVNKPANIPYNRPFYFFKSNEQSMRMGPWFARRDAPSKPLQLFFIEEDISCEKNVAAVYPAVVKDIEAIMNRSHINHPWYWNPGETQAIFNEKKKNAKETNQLIDEYRPNGMKLMPWEKKSTN